MEHKYIKLVHANPGNQEWFVVNWCLGNTCNFSCSYCPKNLHDGSIRWPQLDKVKNFIKRVVDQVSPRKVYFEFTGGEVTLYKEFTEVCQYVTSLGGKVGLISNGSRTLRWWEENKKYIDHVCISYHPEFSDADHFINVISLLNNDVRVHANVMMSPKNFEQCLDVAKRLREVKNISIALQPLIVNFGDQLYEYTEDQHKVIDNQFELIVKYVQWDKTFQYYRGAMKMVDADGNEATRSAHRFINEKTNDWSGWNCYAGAEQIIVDLGGHIYRGWCGVGGRIGHIHDTELTLPNGPVLCHKTMCHCNFDIMSTKEKVNV